MVYLYCLFRFANAEGVLEVQKGLGRKWSFSKNWLAIYERGLQGHESTDL